MKIMITGSNGQLGNELQSILKTGTSEIGVMPEALKGAKIFPVDVDTLDITDNTAVRKYVLENKPNVIINCAAMTNVDGCETDYETAFKVKQWRQRLSALSLSMFLPTMFLRVMASAPMLSGTRLTLKARTAHQRH